MSKELYLLRHAKSDWDDPSLDDRDRVLNERGRRNAPAMGAALGESMQPMSVRVSPAQRAQLTLAGLQDGWPDLRQCEHQVVEALYTFASGDLVDYIREQDDAEPALFLLGHNPGLTGLVNWVCGETVIANLPTAGFAHLSLDIDSWPELQAGCGRMARSLYPRDLMG